MKRGAPALLVLLSCAQGITPSVTTFDATPQQEVLSQSGALTVRLFQAKGRPVARGVNTVWLSVERESNADAEGLQLALLPWMPVMGHGSAVTPTVTPADGGFLVENLSLAMPGRWDVRCDFDGAVVDHATFAFDVP